MSVESWKYAWASSMRHNWLAGYVEGIRTYFWGDFEERRGELFFLALFFALQASPSRTSACPKVFFMHVTFILARVLICRNLHYYESSFRPNCNFLASCKRKYFEYSRRREVHSKLYALLRPSCQHRFDGCGPAERTSYDAKKRLLELLLCQCGLGSHWSFQ